MANTQTRWLGSCSRTIDSTHAPCDADILRMMLKKREADPNDEDEDGSSPLWHTARQGDEEILILLLRIEGLEADNKDREMGRTPFSCAVGNLAVMQLLFAIGRVDIESGDNNGRTALSHAVEKGAQESVDFILSVRAEPDVEDDSGRTPLSFAAANYYHEDIVERLLNTEGVAPTPETARG